MDTRLPTAFDDLLNTFREPMPSILTIDRLDYRVPLCATRSGSVCAGEEVELSGESGLPADCQTESAIVRLAQVPVVSRVRGKYRIPNRSFRSHQ